MTVLRNSFDGGSQGTTITTGNSGGASGDAFDSVSVNAGAGLIFDATAMHAPFAGKFTVGGVAADVSAVWSTALGSNHQIWFRFYVYMPQIVPSQYRIFDSLSGASLCCAIFIDTTGHLWFSNTSGSQIFKLTTPLYPNQWMRVEGFIIGGATTGQVELKLFLDPDSATASESQTSAATQSMIGDPSQVRFGNAGTAVADLSFSFDDIGVSTTGYLGRVLQRTAADTIAPLVESAKSTLGAMFVTAFQPNAFQGSTGLQLVRTAADTLGSLAESAARAALSRVRTGADTIGSLTEAAARAFSTPRTATDTLDGFTESVVRGALSRVRTATDTLGSFTESATRAALNFVRTSTDTLGSFAETTARAAAKSRTATDTLDALVETAIGLKIIIRTATDSLGQLTESAARSAMSFLRTATDTVSTLTESATRSTSAPRTVADTLQALAETAARAALARSRTAVDTIGSLTESIARSFSTPRTAADTIGSLVETVARAGAKSRVATETLDAITEVAIGLKVIIRTATDTLGALTETAARAATSRIRTATDTISDVTETVTRAGAKIRTAVDALGSFTETAVGLKIIIRTAVDTLSSFTETAARGSMAFTRTATDNVGSLAETAARGATARVRTAIETLSALSESVVRSTQANRLAVDTISALSETTTRGLGLVRTASDTIAPLVETAIRAPQAFVRSVVDIIGALVETVARVVSGGAVTGRVSAKDFLANSVSIVDSLSAVVATESRLASLVSPYAGAVSVAATDGIVAATYARVILNDNPVAYWPLSETSGTVAKDATGHGYDGVISNATLGQPGIPGDRGTTMYMPSNPTVIVPYYSALHPEPGPFSAEFWMANLAAGTVGGGFFDNSDGFLIVGRGSVPGTVWCGQGGNNELSYNAIPYDDATGIFHYWTWTRTGDSGASILYRDGVAVASSAPSLGIPANTGTTNLGERALGSPAAQRMGHFAIYNYVLTPSQILSHYQAGASAPSLGSVGAFDFD